MKANLGDRRPVPQFYSHGLKNENQPRRQKAGFTHMVLKIRPSQLKGPFHGFYSHDLQDHDQPHTGNGQLHDPPGEVSEGVDPGRQAACDDRPPQRSHETSHESAIAPREALYVSRDRGQHNSLRKE